MMKKTALLLLVVTVSALAETSQPSSDFQEEDYGEGLKVLVTYTPEDCVHRAQAGDVIHYHYVGRLGSNGQEFGKSFDYNSPYIVALGQGRIIAGMDRGLVGTCLWERRRITIPPHLGYGERGVGSTIPPNSVLVFYIRMIRIERNGLALGEDERLEDLYEAGLQSYTAQDWNATIDLMEESIRIFKIYETATLSCSRECQDIPQLTDSQLKIVRDYNPDLVSVNQQFMRFAGQARCLRECKKRTLPRHLRQLDPATVADMRQYKPYSYLHYAYYQVGENEKGARCCFTYNHFNPEDEYASSSLPYYRSDLGLPSTGSVFREGFPSPGHSAFLKGRAAYNKTSWLEAADLFESSLLAFKTELTDCQLLCEDALTVNITQDVHPQKAQLYETNDLVIDTLEYFELLKIVSLEVLECQASCVDKVSNVPGYPLDQNMYLPSIFNHLQFCYYNLGQLKKAAESAATFQALDPSDIVMNNNIKFYKTSLKLAPELFTPRQVYVDLQENWEERKRLLYFARNGDKPKKSGVRGDQEANPPAHSEL